MRRIVLLFLVISLSGCGKDYPKLAGRKWADALGHHDIKLRKKAAFTLGNIGPSDPVVLPALIRALKDTDPGVRCQAILALLKCRPFAGEALAELTELQNTDRDNRVRAYAAEALKKMRSPP
jgi:HEAT repeat protein